VRKRPVSSLCFCFFKCKLCRYTWARAVNGMARGAATPGAAAAANSGGGEVAGSNPGDGDGGGGGGERVDGDGESISRNGTEASPSSFHITPKYTALHWRRGDKCGVTKAGLYQYNPVDP
jgi:hypothetical protein